MTLADRQDLAVHTEPDRFSHFIVGGCVDPWLPESHEQNVAVNGIVGTCRGGICDAGHFTIIDRVVGPGCFLERGL